MKVFLTRTVGLPNAAVQTVLEVLLPFNGPLQFLIESRPLMLSADPFSWKDFFQIAALYRQEKEMSSEDFLIVLTQLRNKENWFSGFSFQGERTIFIYTNEWENFIFCEPFYPIAYEVIANILQTLTPSETPEGKSIFHQSPIGCMNDMCGWKPDIIFRLRTADICEDCQSLILASIKKDLFVQALEIFEGLRRKMLFTARHHKPLTFEENMPFTVAITKRKLSMTNEPFRKMLMLIDHFDSIVRTAVFTIVHLSKSSPDIKKFLHENNLSERPSLGSWVDALARLAQETSNYNWSLQLPSDFAKKVKKVVELANSSRIVSIRNEQRGHGYVECHDEGYKQTFMESLRAIDEIEKKLSPLFCRFKYYHIIGMNRVEANQFRIKIHNLAGSNPAFLEEEVTVSFQSIEEIPIEDHFYLVSPDLKKWTDLFPYIQYCECPICHHHRLLVADGIYLLDPLIGHRFQKGENA